MGGGNGALLLPHGNRNERVGDMAVYIPIRPKWNPRGVVVNYVCHNQLCVRSWPRGYRDAKTAAQRQQRDKMAQVCNVLPHVKSLLSLGYSPLAKRNGRRVGGYQMAVSRALREWFTPTPQGDALDCARLQLTDGIRQLPQGLHAQRHGNKLHVSWGASLAWSKPRLLLAAREPKADQWLSVAIPLEGKNTAIEAQLPKAWKGKRIEIWIAFVGEGKGARTATYHAGVAAPQKPTNPSTTSLPHKPTVSTSLRRQPAGHQNGGMPSPAQMARGSGNQPGGQQPTSSG